MEKVILKSISAHSDEIDELPINYKDSWLMHRKLVEFLRQPLNLGMFVPVSVHGNILNEPVNYSAYEVGMSGKDFNFNFVDCQEYQEAKDRVLFEGLK